MRSLSIPAALVALTVFSACQRDSKDVAPPIRDATTDADAALILPPEDLTEQSDRPVATTDDELDADVVLQTGLSIARREDKNALVYLSAPW